MKEFSYLSEKEKRLLAILFKRINFVHVLECTDGGNDKDQAYEMLDVIEKLQKELIAQGYNPR